MRRKDRTRRPLPSPRTLQNPHQILRRPQPAHKDGCTAGYPVPTRQRAVKIHGIDILLGHDTNHCFRSQLVHKTLDGNAHLLEGIKAYAARKMYEFKLLSIIQINYYCEMYSIKGVLHIITPFNCCLFSCAKSVISVI